MSFAQVISVPLELKQSKPHARLALILSGGNRLVLAVLQVMLAIPLEGTSSPVPLVAMLTKVCFLVSVL